MKSSSSANSFAERRISCSPRQTRRLAGSRRGSPTSRTAGRSPWPRRTRARRAGEELRERERLRQVVVRPGVQPGNAILDAVARRQHEHRHPHVARPKLRQTCTPSSPGSIRSRTIASYGTARAIQRRRRPSRRCRAAWPSSTSPRRRSPAIFGSSSTTSTRMDEAWRRTGESSMREALTGVSFATLTVGA
jgi:hypothetical protein